LKKRKIKRKPAWYIITSVILIIVFFASINFSKGIYRIWRLSWIKHKEEKALNDTIKEKELLELEIEKLTEDSLYIEEIARKEYGMVKNGEEVFRITIPDSVTEGGK